MKKDQKASPSVRCALSERALRTSATALLTVGWDRRGPDGPAQGDHGRVSFLDGLRGALAVVVVAFHATLPFLASIVFQDVALAAVLVFFAMSGYVLARAYDGRVVTFLLRRIVRLWPLYAACVVVGHVLEHSPPRLLELFFVVGYFPQADPPAWSLWFEMWAAPALPLAFYLVRRSLAAGGLLVAVLLGAELASQPDPSKLWLSQACIAAGIVAARLGLSLPPCRQKVLLWLGKISFSLYLTHQLVLGEAYRLGGAPGVLLAVPVVFAVAWASWWGIERPSIALSRRFGRLEAGPCLSEPLDDGGREVRGAGGAAQVARAHPVDDDGLADGGAQRVAAVLQAGVVQHQPCRQ